MIMEETGMGEHEVRPYGVAGNQQSALADLSVSARELIPWRHLSRSAPGIEIPG